MHRKKMNSSTCIFCRIVAKQLPSTIICEDTQNIALLPLEQEIFGHTLIIPKNHYESLTDMPYTPLAALMQFVQKLAVEFHQRLGSKDFNLLAACGKASQQSVPHFHFHYFPRFPNDGLNTWPNLPDSINSRREEFLDFFDIAT